MPTLNIKVKVGDTEVEVKADGTLDKETIHAIRSILAPLASRIPSAAAVRDNASLNNNTDDIAVNSQDAFVRNVNLYAKFKELMLNVFKLGQWFTSIDAKEVFHDTYGILLKSSTVTTYLRRMEDEGLLTSKRQGRLLQFRISAVPLYATLAESEFNELKA
ncbi:MAG: hypothetical protein NDP13_00090 [Crenarchaeota archaeon]|nr:hypothetical protein [Thermoproteota archaeon]MCR8453392.1 hypothetical protein [Thermoproteota archaeon]MCR8455705.1 hypothetical protein [Thermoproteota archaeon]MCR8462542.1 hypothetical protein [Thermoproteota archaeon]MCR8470730.1 hypothetical protein [Thermoproteota archaeon]